MYWEYFGFKEPPFALTPNPAFLFLSTPHQEAFAHLLFAIENRAGFIELSGEVGTGKTTIVRTLLNQLDPETYRTALIFNPTLSPLGLLQEINGELGLVSDVAEMRELHQALNAYLLEENRAGRTVVLVIDEAQNLSAQVLEQVRLISNLETESAKLIQIVLVGQPELKNLLARTELRQLNQRITVRYHLKSMCLADTGDYIRHRIRFAAGGREPLAFTAGAVKRIFRFSGGLPRLINGACDRALLLAYTREAREVTPAMATLSIADLQKELAASGRNGALRALAAGLVLAVCAALAFFIIPVRGLSVRGLPPVKTAPAPAAVPLARADALKGLAASSEQDNLYAAVNAVLAAWRLPAAVPVPGRPASLRTLARLRGLTATRVTGDLDALARLDAPALLLVTVPGAGTRLIALTALERDAVRVVPAVAGRSRLSRSELALLWSGGATLLWKDFHGISSRKGGGEGVKQLQGLLKEVGCFQGEATGLLDPETLAAIAEFQRRERLAIDGRAAGQTLMLLYRRAGGFFPPGLQGEAGGMRPGIAGRDAGANGTAGRFV